MTLSVYNIKYLFMPQSCMYVGGGKLTSYRFGKIGLIAAYTNIIWRQTS